MQGSIPPRPLLLPLAQLCLLPVTEGVSIALQSPVWGNPASRTLFGAKPSVTIRCLSMPRKHCRLFCNKCKWQTRGQGWSQGQRLVSNLYFLFMSCCNNFEGMKEISRNVRQGTLIRKLAHSFSALFFGFFWSNWGQDPQVVWICRCRFTPAELWSFCSVIFLFPTRRCLQWKFSAILVLVLM